MINLLPPDVKNEMHFARINTVLISWIILCVIGIAGIGLVAVGGFFYMSRVESGTRQQKTTIEKEISDDKLDSYIKDYTSFTNDVKTVSTVLQKQVLFSSLITRLAAVLPSGVVVKQMNLGEKDNALTLDFVLPNRSSATVLQANLQDPANKLFSSADILNATCATTEDGTETCSAQIRVLFDPSSRLLLYQPTATNTGSTSK